MFRLQGNDEGFVAGDISKPADEPIVKNDTPKPEALTPPKPEPRPAHRQPEIPDKTSSGLKWFIVVGVIILAILAALWWLGLFNNYRPSVKTTPKVPLISEEERRNMEYSRQAEDIYRDIEGDPKHQGVRFWRCT